MKHRLLTLLAIGCAFRGLLLAEEEAFAPASDISFTISTARSRYERRQSITVSYRIVNVGSGPLYVPREWDEKCPRRPHVWAWLENGAGKQFAPGYGGSCSGEPRSLAERMAKEAVLLKPGDHLDGTVELDLALSGALAPGLYRIEVDEDEFSAAEKEDLSGFPGRFVRGRVSASARITVRR